LSIKINRAFTVISNGSIDFFRELFQEAPAEETEAIFSYDVYRTDMSRAQKPEQIDTFGRTIGME
jgi:hypothetical protein